MHHHDVLESTTAKPSHFCFQTLRSIIHAVQTVHPQLFLSEGCSFMTCDKNRCVPRSYGAEMMRPNCSQRSRWHEPIFFVQLTRYRLSTLRTRRKSDRTMRCRQRWSKLCKLRWSTLITRDVRARLIGGRQRLPSLIQEQESK